MEIAQVLVQSPQWPVDLWDNDAVWVGPHASHKPLPEFHPEPNSVNEIRLTEMEPEKLCFIDPVKSLSCAHRKPLSRRPQNPFADRSRCIEDRW